jgi:hypothetical protein
LDGQSSSNIYEGLMIVYGDNTSSCTRVFEWVHGFQGEPLDIHVDPRFRQPDIMTDRTII